MKSFEMEKTNHGTDDTGGGGYPVALLTDFGPASMYVGIMHGVIAARAPEIRVIDLAHDVPAQNIAAAAVCLEAASDYFPRPTVFCCVVDPGVGSERRALAVSDGRHFYIAPDNGVLTLVEQAAREEKRDWQVRAIDPDRVAGDEPMSATFHGRDLFAPAAAEVARGGIGSFESISLSVDSWKWMEIPKPECDGAAGSLTVHALAVDSFGNAITTLRRRDWEALWETVRLGGAGKPAGRTGGSKVPDAASVEVEVGGLRWRGIARTFSDVAPEEPVAYWGSGGRLEIGVREGSAAFRFSIVQGTAITLRCVDESPSPSAE